ncbi:MAG: hypothetical protein ABW252_06620 [Polyangiales bacterium]
MLRSVANLMSVWALTTAAVLPAAALACPEEKQKPTKPSIACPEEKQKPTKPSIAIACPEEKQKPTKPSIA